MEGLVYRSSFPHEIELTPGGEASMETLVGCGQDVDVLVGYVREEGLK